MRRCALESSSSVQDAVFVRGVCNRALIQFSRGHRTMAESTASQRGIAQRTSKQRGRFAAAAALVAGVVNRFSELLIADVVARISERRVEAGVDGDAVPRGGNTAGTKTSILNTRATGTALGLFCAEGSTGDRPFVEGSGHRAIGVSPSTSSSFGANVGVAGQITNGWGMGSFRDSDYGVSGSGGAAGVASGTTCTGAAAAMFCGLVDVVGDFTVVNGAKSTAVPHPDGSHRRLYCMESPESWLEDFGVGQLVNGQAQVQLEAGFAAVVNSDSYHVFITEYEDHNALYVVNRTNTGFGVRAKTSNTAKGTFSYRIVAKRKDIEGPRLEKVRIPSAE